ncbi:Bifunctional protein GlmU [uncultured archaeon]|nr:Bifunctional protein GlmU [uncultured archaeon]
MKTREKFGSDLVNNLLRKDAAEVACEADLRNLDAQVGSACLNGLLMQRIYNKDGSTGAWISEKTNPAHIAANIATDPTTIIRGRHTEIESDVTIGKNTTIKNTRIGHEAAIGNETVLECSSIGKRAKIGDHVFISNTHIHKDVTICDNVVMISSAIGQDIRIPAGAEIKNETIKRRG